MNKKSGSRGAEGPSDGWLFVGLIGLLAWVPLPLGSNRLLPIALLVAFAVALLLAMMWQWRRRWPQLTERLSAYSLPIGLLGLIVLWQVFLTLPLPSGWVQGLSPEAWAVQQGVTGSFTLSLDRFQSWMYASLGVGFLCAFVVTVVTVRTRERLEQLAMAMTMVGTAYAVVGVALHALKAHYHVFYMEIVHERVLGPFSYYNFTARFFVMALCLGIGVMLARLGERQPSARNWKDRVVRMLKFMLSEKMVLRLLLVVLVIALVLTRSRMGNASFFLALLLVGLMTLALTRRSAPAMVALITSLVVVDVVVVGSWIGLEQVVKRLEQTSATEDEKADALAQARAANMVNARQEESFEARQHAAVQSLQLIEDFPLTGTGPGSFYNAYIRYRSLVPRYWDHAHNDYAEIAADSGLIGLGLMGALAASTVWVSALNIKRRRSALPRGISFGVLMSLVALLLHSVVDFNMHNPANALWLVVTVAIGWVSYRLPSKGQAG